MAKKALDFRSGDLYRIPADELLIVGRDLEGEEWQDHPLYTHRALRAPDESMVESILELGVLQAVRVTKLTETGNKPVVELGRGRVIAAREAQRRQIQAAKEAGTPPPPPIQLPVTYVRYNPARTGANVLCENAQRTAVDPLTEAEDMARQVDRCGDAQLVATATGYSPATVRNRLKLLELSIKVQRAVRKEKIAPAAALTFHGKTAKEQDALLAQLLADAAANGGKVTTRKARKATGKRTTPSKKSLCTLLAKIEAEPQAVVDGLVEKGFAEAVQEGFLNGFVLGLQHGRGLGEGV
tara:strand:- start:468 stop:1358 length:891 start_codon:yes stop_codon:yes gene_type:complete